MVLHLCVRSHPLKTVLVKITQIAHDTRPLLSRISENLHCRAEYAVLVLLPVLTKSVFHSHRGKLKSPPITREALFVETALVTNLSS